MAQRKVKTKICDRDLKETPAETTIAFTYMGTDYELDLCDNHARQFDREISGWTRVAREVTTRNTFAADNEQWRDLLEREARHRAEAGDVTPYAATLLRHGEDEDDDKLDEPAQFAEWGLTEHAKERQLERGFTHEEVMLAVTAPEKVYLHSLPGRRRHVRGRVQAVVYPENRAVLTVMFTNRADYVAHQKEMQSVSAP